LYVTTHRYHTDVRDTLTSVYGPTRRPVSPRPALVHAATGRATRDSDDLAETLETFAEDLDVHLSASESWTGARIRPPVWHTSLWQIPGSRILSDAEWTFVARHIVAAAGIDDPAQGPGCPWIAIRDRARQHLHLIAPAARRDGTKPELLGSATRITAEAGRIRREIRAQNSVPVWDPPAGFGYDPARTVFLRSHAPGVITAEGGTVLARSILLAEGFGDEHSAGRRWMRTPYGADDDTLIACAENVRRELKEIDHHVQVDETLFGALNHRRGFAHARWLSAHARAVAASPRPSTVPGPTPAKAGFPADPVRSRRSR